METAKTEKKGIDKRIIIIIAAVAVAIIAIVIGAVFMFGEKTYRVLKIYQVEGQATVVHNDGSEVTPYENMLLQSGDQISLVEGTLIIKADEDKYIYLENNTTIILEADGSAANSKTSIQLLEGAVINQIEEPLSSKSVYELNTQNATMSVRGTVYRAAYSISSNGVIYTDVQTFEGEVMTGLIHAENGGVTVSESDSMRHAKGNTENMAVPGGKRVRIFSDEKETAYEDPEPQDIEVTDLSKQAIDILGIIVENSDKDLSDTLDVLGGPNDANPPETCVVTFMNGTSVFGTVEVPYEETVDEPMLMPTAKGHWKLKDTDEKLVFPITVTEEDTVVVWVDESTP